MTERISNYILSKISNNNDTPDQKEIILFGITRIVEDVPKYLAIIIICILLGILKEMLAVLAVTIVYKRYIGGVHAKTNISCFVFSLLYFVGTIYISKYIKLDIINQYGIYMLLYIFGIYTAIVYAPADVPELPIINIKRRKKSKIMAIIMQTVLYMIAIYFIKNKEYTNIIIYTIFYLNVMATRTVYKLFKNDYGYETYVPDELLSIE